jgi:hypothetical protein
LGPLERANLNHWKNPDDGQSPKTQYLCEFTYYLQLM